MTEAAASSLALTDEIKALVNGSLANGTPMLLAAVSPAGKPVLSFRGSVQTYSDDQLGLWARHSQGGTLEAIAANPNVVLVYRSPTTPVLQFHGRARIATDEAERKRVFENAPEREQASDPERRGAAIIVDLDRIEGVVRVGPDGPVFCRLVRAAS
ncbi:MAG: pyridoxamine 5'-phosphate oxidase family protein [Caulobacteraceae bacterium]|nr:pyridoxamine 5'-phosphate oxidase family protein [Caulobacteraceae bacterium]